MKQEEHRLVLLNHKKNNAKTWDHDKAKNEIRFLLM